MGSRAMDSARACAGMVAGQTAVGWPAEKPAGRRLLARVLRFCAKQAWRKRSKPAGSTLSSVKRGAKSRRRTVEKTAGWGEKACGGRVKRDSTREWSWVVAERRP